MNKLAFYAGIAASVVIVLAWGAQAIRTLTGGADNRDGYWGMSPGNGPINIGR